MSNSNVPSLGRFSSQILTYLGAQRTVKLVGSQFANTYKYATGSISYPDVGSVQQYMGTITVVGNYTPAAYDSTKSFFISRGASIMYAEAMTALLIDMSYMLGVSPQSLLENSEVMGKLTLSTSSYSKFNNLRDSGNQVGKATAVTNNKSLQSRAIRA